MLEDIFKSMPFFQTFLSTLKKGGHVFSYLIVSKDAFSANMVAKLFAQAIICPEMCNECENCKKLQAGGHPDVKIYPEKGKLLVEESKRIVEESFVKPIFAERKVLIVQNIENSTEEAQNKLLKSLEEPNEKVAYVLTSSFPEKILPTIKSRCIKVEVPPLPAQTVLPLLKGDDQEKSLAVAIGGGYLSKTLQLAERGDLQELALLAIELLVKLSSSKQAILWSKRLIDKKEDFSLIMEIFGLVLEDVLLLKTNKKAGIRLEGLRKQLNEVSDELSVKCLVALSGLIVKAMKEIGYNVNFPLVVDNLVMNILEVKYLCK